MPASDHTGHATTRRSVKALRTLGAIRLDGRLDEPSWRGASAASDFRQIYPRPGAPASKKTDVRVLYDESALYVGVRMYDHPDSIVAQLAHRDATGIYSDWVHVMIDSYHDQRTAFRFSVNPRGVQKDALQFNDVEEDLNWDAVWEVATRVDSLGWVAEYRIPFSQLRYSPADIDAERIWGFQVKRDIARYQERDAWAASAPEDPGVVSRFGVLEGMRGLPAPRTLELLPSLSARLIRAPGSDGNPFYEKNDLTTSPGADVKYGLPAGLTLTATLNPDFGQVEVDPAVVNLTAFETFFPEKRPFFLEGADVFHFGEVRTFNDYGFQEYFYSRRIGRTPELQVSAPEVAYVDMPDQTTILGALKVNGRTSRGWTLGLLDAVVAPATARYITDSGFIRSTPVEPLTNYFVGRARKDINAGATVFGAMLTGTHRRTNDTLLASLSSRALFGGLDFEHGWANHSWYLSGYVGWSVVGGSTRAMAQTQETSARYYQRPDAGYVTFDSTRRTLSGHVAEIVLQKAGAFYGSLDYKETSPGFEIGDLGFQDRADYRSVASELGFQNYHVARIVRNSAFFASANHVWNFGGNPITETYQAGAAATFANLWSASASLGYSPETFSDRLTRGGPLAKLPRWWETSLSLGSDSRKPVSATAKFGYMRDAVGATNRRVGVAIDLRPNASIHVSVGPTAGISQETNHYVLGVPDSLAVLTFGRRYVFADLRQTSLSAEIRTEWALSRTLSLQLYAQPLVSAGQYSNFKEFVKPGSFWFGVYGRDLGTIATASAVGSYIVDPDGPGPAASFHIDQPDFNVRSLRGNVVLRWQYRAGSDVFLVWQQLRSDVVHVGDFEFARDIGGVFQALPTNAFLIKATFWISR